MNLQTVARVLPALALASGLLLPSLARAMPGDHLEAMEYARSGPWTLKRVTGNGQLAACSMQAFFASETGLYYATDGANDTLGFSGDGSAAAEKPIKVEVWFDDRRKDRQTLVMDLFPDVDGWDWRQATVPAGAPGTLLGQRIGNSRKITFSYFVKGAGKVVQSFPRP